MRANQRQFIIVLAIVLLLAFILMLVATRKHSPQLERIAQFPKYNLLYTFIPLDDSAVCQEQIFAKIYHREPKLNLKNYTRKINCDLPLFIYDNQQKTSKQISMEVAQTLKYQYMLDDYMVSQYCTTHYDKFEHPTSTVFASSKQPQSVKYPCIVRANEFINLNIPYSTHSGNEFIFLGWILP